MKKAIIIIFIFMFMLFITGCKKETINEIDNSDNTITKEKAYEGVYNYCDELYNISNNSEEESNTYIELVEDGDSTYKFVFRSYTGALTYFYVDKESGNTKVVEYVPALDVENEAETINISDYLN